jgi:hypothetical protein
MASTRLHRCVLAAALPACLVMAAGRAVGQTAEAEPAVSDVTGVDPADGGPVVIGGSREAWKKFDLLRLDTALEFRFESRQDTRKQTGLPDQTVKELRFRETLDVSGEAIIGHKNLLDLMGTVQIGREDITIDDSEQPESDDETNLLTLYDISGVALATSVAPIDVYARRDESQLDRAFAGSITQTVMEEGIGTRIRSDVAPTTIRYFHRQDDLKGGFGDIDSTTVQDSLNLQTALKISEVQRLELWYALDSITEDQAGGYSDAYDRHDLNLVHTYAFGGEEYKRNELRSSLHYYDQSGRQAQRDLRWDELLTLRHSERLDTRYSVTVDSREVRGDTQELSRAEASIRHRLYESLVSVGTIGAQRLSGVDGFTSDDVYVRGDLDYTKRVPLGRFDAAVGGTLNSQSNSERGSTIRVVDEAYTYIDGFPIVIARRNVVAGSIVVTPVAGFPVYQEGSDYRVAVFADRTEIRGIVGGALVNGQIVEVSYDIGPEGASEIETLSTSVSVRYTLTEGLLRGLAVYATRRDVTHDVSADQPETILLDDTQDTLLGTEYRRGELELRGEYEMRESQFDPYTVQRYQGFYTIPLSSRSRLGLELSREVIDYSEQDDQVTLDRGALHWNSRLSRTLDLTATLEYRNEESTQNGTSTGFDQNLGLSWNWRQTSIYASFRNSTLEGEDSDQTSQFFQFGFRRTF